MTDQEKHAVIGRVVSELGEVRKELAYQKQRAEHLSARFAEMGRLLRENPGAIFFTADLPPGPEHSRHTTVFELTDFDGRALQEMAESVRRLEAGRRELEQKLASLGYPL